MADAPKAQNLDTSVKREASVGVESEKLKVESEESVESALQVEKPEQEAQVAEQAEAPTVPVATLPIQPIQIPKDPVLEDIEEILAEDLTDVFLGLPEASRPAFKQKGEETALKILDMVNKGKLKIKGVLKLIKEWLKIVPGISKFFLEQAAKIKADKIMDNIEISEQEPSDSENTI